MYTQSQSTTQVLPPKILPTIYQNGTEQISEPQPIPITQSVQQVQAVPVQQQVTYVPQIVYIPQVIQGQQQIQPQKPLTPSPPYISFIPPTPVSKSLSDNMPKPVYQFYKLVPINTSFAQVPIEQSITTNTSNYNTLSTTPIM